MAETTLHSGAVVLRHRGVKLLGVLNRPERADARRRVPGVLFLHGFPGAEKNVDIQRRLLELGVASFSLHFSGAWGSEGLYRFTQLVPQARAGLKFLGSRDFVDARRLAVFGFSMGGFAALNVAGREPRLRAAVAVAPVGGKEMIGPRNHEFVERLSRPLRAPGVAALTKDFHAAVTRFDPHDAVRRMKCPLLLVHGDADGTVPCVVTRGLFADAHAPKKLVIARGARHDFLDRRPWLSRLVTRWLAKRLA